MMLAIGNNFLDEDIFGRSAEDGDSKVFLGGRHIPQNVISPEVVFVENFEGSELSSLKWRSLVANSAYYVVRQDKVEMNSSILDESYTILASVNPVGTPAIYGAMRIEARMKFIRSAVNPSISAYISLCANAMGDANLVWLGIDGWRDGAAVANFAWGANDVGTNNDDTGVAIDSNWHLFRIDINSTSEVKYYIDNVLVGTNNQVNSIPFNTSLYVKLQTWQYTNSGQVESIYVDWVSVKLI